MYFTILDNSLSLFLSLTWSKFLFYGTHYIEGVDNLIKNNKVKNV